ncbi:MAG: CARDB domain-containing protein, partial [Candidatus Moranbacteria bacterium]|nr:CARDB domain-containing protein [Candidatus Moranbacteria bacterium]
IQIYADSKNTGANGIDSDDEIEGRYFLSEGYKKDSSSDWIKIGSDITHGSSLEPGESHREDKAFRLWEYNIIQPGGVYNVVYCIDRIRNEDNDGGAYEEEHESDNCTTEAVFTVQSETPPPPSTDKFVWSSAGAVANRTCTQITEPADPHTWGDNFFCADSNYGVAWSSNGPIANMRCTQVIESADPHSWNDNYLCIPNTSNIYFSWSSAGPIDSQACTQWLEAADPDTWKDNFLCYQEVIPRSLPFLNMSVINISIEENLYVVKIFPEGSFDLGMTIVNEGNDLSNNVSVGYYLDDALIATHVIAASDLNNNAYRSDALSDIPVPLVPGDHEAKICIDPNNVIQETDETDNCHSVKVEVEKHVNPAVIMQLFN